MRLPLINGSDIFDDLIEISLDTVNGINFLAGPIDGTGDAAESVFNDISESFGCDVVKVGSVGDV